MDSRKWVCLAILSIVLISSILVVSFGTDDSSAKSQREERVDSLMDNGYYCEYNGITWIFSIENGQATLVSWDSDRPVNGCFYIPEFVWKGADSEAIKYPVVKIGSEFMRSPSPTDKSIISCIYIPKGIELIGSQAFYNIRSLKEVVFQEGSILRTIESSAFEQSGYDISYVPTYENLWNGTRFLIVGAQDSMIAYVSQDETGTTQVQNGEKGADYFLCKNGEFTFSIVFEGIYSEDQIELTKHANGRITDAKVISTSAIPNEGNQKYTEVKINLKLSEKSSRLTVTVDGNRGCAVNVQSTDGISGQSPQWNDRHKGILDGTELNSLESKLSFSISLPDSVESIGDTAFGGSSGSSLLEEVVIGKGSNLKSIGDGAFPRVLGEVFIPEGVEKIGDRAINRQASLVVSSENQHYMMDGSGGFLTKDGSTLLGYYGVGTNYSFVDSIKKVQPGAFENTTVTRIEVRGGIDWGLFPFQGTSIEEVTFDSGMVVIPDYLLGGTKIKTITIPNTIERIGTKAFYRIGTLESIEFQEQSHIYEIGPYAFASNYNLETITFNSHADGVYCEIDEGAFFNCGVLSKVKVDPKFTLKTIGEGAFAKYVGGTEPVAFNSDGSNNTIVIPSSVESIGKGAFSKASSDAANVQDNVWSSGEGMLKNNAQFANRLIARDFSISFCEGSNLYSIDDWAFQGFYDIKSIDLSSCGKLQTIGSGAFSYSFKVADGKGGLIEDHTNVTSVSLPDSLISIGSKAFYHGDSKALNNVMEELVIPSEVTEVGDYAFGSIVKRISFAEGSQIKYIGDLFVQSIPAKDDYYTLDLSNCLHLESVFISQKTILPAGVYEINSKIKLDAVFKGTSATDDVEWAPILNSEKVVWSYSGNDKTVVIDADDCILNKNLLDGDYSVLLDSDNDHFEMVAGLLVWNGEGEKSVIGFDSSKLDLIILKDQGIETIVDYAFRNSSLASLRIPSGIAIGDYIISGTAGVDLYILGDPASVSDVSFEESRGLSVFEGRGVNPQIRSMIPESSVIYTEILGSGEYVYLPIAVEGISLGEVDVVSDGERLVIKGLSFAGGYTLYDMDIYTSAGYEVIDHDTLAIILTSEETIIRMEIRDRLVGPFIQVLFDGEGGTCDGSSWTYSQIPVGATIVDSDLPSFILEGFEFEAWIDMDGHVWDDFDLPLEKDLYLTASWKNRNPTITIDSIAGYVLNNSVRTDSVSVTSGSEVELSMVAFPGFYLDTWILDGKNTEQPASEPLKLSSVTKDHVVSVSYMYSSPSSGLDSQVNIDLPSSDELNDLIKVSELGGFVNTQGMVWTGHSSVPLIIDDSVFFRSGAYIYKAESDTGYVLRSQSSKNSTSFYHYLGYGDGLVIDYASGVIYNTDLEKICECPVSGLLEYHDGYFYTSGSDIKRFSSESCYAAADGGNVAVEKLGTMENVYSSYGMSGSVFVDNYVYRVYADKDERGIVGMDLDTKKVVYKKMGSLTSMFMDDGWLTYSDGTLYLTGYIEGLFGAVACSGNNVIAYVDVDGLEFGQEKNYLLEGEVRFMSAFLIYEDKGFVNSGGHFYAFDIVGSGKDRKISIKENYIGAALSHGSMVMNTKDVSDGLLYFYVIPYQTESVTMSMVQYSLDEGAGFGTYTSKLPHNYNSQAVRSDVDGRMIWYNDSGHIYTYTTSEKNVYYFLIQDGSSARWYESHGATAADALVALGRSVVTLNSIDGLATVNGKAVSEEWSINVLTDKSDKTKAGMIGQYEWVKLDNLYSDAHDTDHYYVITDSNTLPTSSTTFIYAVEGGLRTYTFADNIGDRSIIGKELIRAEANNTVTIRFYDGEKQFIDSVLIGEKGSKVTGSFPSVYKYGMIAEWKDVKNEVVSLPTTFDTDQKYYLSWVIAPATYMIELDPDTTDKTRVTFSLEMTRDFGLEDLSDANLYVIGYYDGSDGKRFISTISKIVIEDKKATSVVSLSSDDLVDVSFRIIRGSIPDTTYNNYGSAYWSGGKGA